MGGDKDISVVWAPALGHPLNTALLSRAARTSACSRGEAEAADGGAITHTRAACTSSHALPPHARRPPTSSHRLFSENSGEIQNAMSLKHAG